MVTDEFAASGRRSLKFTDAALREIAQLAHERKTGARALRSIVERLLLDLMYSSPETKPGGEVNIDASDVRELLAGKIITLPTPTGEAEAEGGAQRIEEAAPAPARKRKDKPSAG